MLPLACPIDATSEEMLAENTRPDMATEWAMHEVGNYLYYELTIGKSCGLLVTYYSRD